MAAEGQAVVKLSGMAKVSTLPWPHPDLEVFVQALIDACTLERLCLGVRLAFSASHVSHRLRAIAQLARTIFSRRQRAPRRAARQPPAPLRLCHLNRVGPTCRRAALRRCSRQPIRNAWLSPETAFGAAQATYMDMYILR